MQPLHSLPGCKIPALRYTHTFRAPILLLKDSPKSACMTHASFWRELHIASLASTCRYELHIGAVRLLDYYGGYEDLSPEAYFAAWLVLEEMKSDPCWKFPHRFYCVEDRYEVKKKKAKRSLTHRRPDKMVRANIEDSREADKSALT